MNKKLGSLALKSIAVLGIAVIASEFIQDGVSYAKNTALNGYKSAISWVTRVEVVRQYVPLPNKSLNEILDDASVEHNVPRFLLLAMIEQESYKEMKPNHVRFEPWVYKQMTKRPFPNEIENQLQASSIGLMQVIPYFHNKEKECQVSFEKLFDPDTNVRCGARVLRDCLNSNPKGTHFERVKKALKCYNGGDDYPQQVIDRVARLALENINIQ